MIPIGQRVSVIEKPTQIVVKTGYLRQVNDAYFTIQAQPGYTKIYNNDRYEIKVNLKKRPRNNDYQKFKTLLEEIEKSIQQ